MSTSVIGCKRKTRLLSSVLLAVLTALALTAAGCGDNSADPSGGLACGNGEAWVLTKSEARAISGVEEQLAKMEEQYPFVINNVDAVGIVFKPNHEILTAVEIKWTDELVDGLIMMYVMMMIEDGFQGNEMELAAMMVIMKPVIFDMVGGKNTTGWYGITAEGSTWSQSGNNLVITSDGEPSEPIPVEISGSTLTITDPDEGIAVILTKKTSVTVTMFDELLRNPPNIPGIFGGGTGGAPA